MLSWFLACVIIASSVAAVSAETEAVSSSARAFELYCPDNDTTLLSQNSGEKLPMASTTKIMSALITLEYAAENNRTVEFTEEMTAEGSSMYLQSGEKLTLYDLAVGMMMQSGNDAANAAAIAIAGDQEHFADLMNARAKSIGMTSTHFVTPSGLDDAEHYSTAHDMALLMAEALKNKDFAEITSKKSMNVDFIEPSDKTVAYPNHNRLLSLYPECIGGKTGYTDTAGRCLVSAAQKDGLMLIVVTLDDRNDWEDHISLYDYGFENYSAVTERPPFCKDMAVVGGKEDTVSLSARITPLVLTKEQAKNVRQQVMLPAFVYAPVSHGDQAGKIVYLLDGEPIGEQRIVFDNDVETDKRKRNIIQYIKDYFNWHS